MSAFMRGVQWVRKIKVICKIKKIDHSDGSKRKRIFSKALRFVITDQATTCETYEGKK